MIGIKEAAGLLASVIIFASSILVPAGDHGTVALQNLDGDGTQAIAESPVPIELEGLTLYDPITSQGTPTAPATLTGTVDRLTGLAATDGRAHSILLGDKRLEIPPGARVTVEHITGTVAFAPADVGTEVTITGTATDLRIQPPRGPGITTAKGPQDGVPVAQAALDGRTLKAGYENAGSFDQIRFRTASIGTGPADVEITVGDQVVPLEAGVRVEVADFVGLVTYASVDADGNRLSLLGYGNVSVAGNAIHHNVSREANATLPTGGSVNQKPQANFSHRPLEAETGETVHFVDRSEDDLAIRDWRWQFGDGTSSTAQHPEHNYADPGTYDVELTVTDAGGKRDSIVKPVTVVNAKPTVDVSWSPLTPAELATVGFSADVTDRDGNDDVAHVNWTFSDGLTFTGGSISRTFPLEGTYTVTVTATDEQGAQGTTQETIQVKNAAPLPSFVVDPENPIADEPTTLLSTSSDVANGTIVNTTWKIRNVGTFYGEEVEVVFPRDGSVSVTLTITDDDGATASVERSLEVGNPPPEVTIDVTPIFPNPDEEVTFDAQVTDDDSPASATWLFSDGIRREGLSISRSFQQGGSYSVTLNVTDADGANGSATRDFDVNHRPIPTLTIPGEGTNLTETALLTDQELELHASVSDPDGNETTVQWAVDGTDPNLSTEQRCDEDPNNESRLTCSWPDDGTHAIELTATDDNDASASRILKVIVLNRKPTLDPSVEADVVNVGDEVTIVSNASDADGHVEHVAWTEKSTLLGEGRQLNHTFQSGGDHELVVNATDDDGANESVAFTVTVNRPPRVEASASPTSVLAGETVTFTTDEATDPDGSDDQLAFHWDFDDGDTADVEDTQHAYTRAGTYDARLTVTDVDGGTTDRVLRIDVDAPPLNAAIQASPDPPMAGETVSLTVTFDGTRDVEEVAWDLGDGTNVTTSTETVEHVYAEPRTVQIEAVVQTTDGASDRTARTLRVTGSTAHGFSITPQLPDGQCPDLSAPNVDINLTNLQTSDRIALDGADETWTNPRGCQLEGAFPAGSWSIGDRFEVVGRIDHAQTIEQHSFEIDTNYTDPAFTLLRAPLVLRNVRVADPPQDAFLGPDDAGANTYHDPTEPVHVRGLLEWGEGTPARNYDVFFRATYGGPLDLLGSQDVTYNEWDEPTALNGSFDVTVPAPVLATNPTDSQTAEGPDLLYPPGRYTVRAFASSGLFSDAERVTFVEDPQGIFQHLEDAGIQP